MFTLAHRSETACGSGRSSSNIYSQPASTISRLLPQGGFGLIGAAEINSNDLSRIDLRTRSGILPRGAAFAACFQLQTQLRAHSCRIANTLTPQVGHHRSPFGGDGKDNFAGLPAEVACDRSRKRGFPLLGLKLFFSGELRRRLRITSN